jgi:hypothetical protein
MKTRFSILNLMILFMIITAGTAKAKPDSLPAGVTRDWLNSLTDENGQRIVQPEEEGDGNAGKILYRLSRK